MSEIKKGFTIICNACGYKGSIPVGKEENERESFTLMGGHSGEGSIYCGKCGESHND